MILVKPNQAGTLSRAMATVEIVRDWGVGMIVSAWSCETCVSTIADLTGYLTPGRS